MSVEKREFYGKEVTEAIRNACENLNVPQEMLDIEVVETGSTGIFGLIRKKARIRVSLKENTTHQEAESTPILPTGTAPSEYEPGDLSQDLADEVPVAEAEEISVTATVEEGGDDEEEDDDNELPGEGEADASPESLQTVKAEVGRLVELMGYPASVDVSGVGLSVTCSIRGEFEEELAGPEGKTLDAIQYLIRKMIARKCSERLRITINVGNFREHRLEELKVRAIELAGLVKETGKTHVLPALNPSERREIHMILQEDKEVRSRSVGDGLFKKILIYKPGKGNRGGRRKSTPRNRRGKVSTTGNNSGEE